MNLNCAILHAADAFTEHKLQEYIDKVPFMTLKGIYNDPLEALRAYYDTKVEVYFVGIRPSEKGEISGMDFCKMLSTPTRVIFLAETGDYAAECFRLDALDYLAGDLSFSLFSQAVNKAARWFNLLEESRLKQEWKKEAEVIYIKSESRIIRINLTDICYIEGLGDYIKIHCKGFAKPVLSLCSMKYMESQLPARDFLRIHRSFILRKDNIESICSNSVVVGGKEFPVGETYRERVKHYITQLSVL